MYFTYSKTIHFQLDNERVNADNFILLINYIEVINEERSFYAWPN